MRKNGDYYWVRANATPIMHQGELHGYMSVRTRLGVGAGTLALALPAPALLAGLNGPALLSFTGTACLGIALMTWWLDHQITRPLGAVLRQALRISSGQQGSRDLSIQSNTQIARDAQMLAEASSNAAMAEQSAQAVNTMDGQTINLAQAMQVLMANRAPQTALSYQA